MTAAVDHPTALRAASASMPARQDMQARRQLIDATLQSVLFLCRGAEDDGFLDRAAGYRRPARTLGAVTPTELDVEKTATPIAC